MLSDYDKNNAQKIIEDPKDDWFSAILMKYLVKLTLDERAYWNKEYPDAVEAVYGKRPGSQSIALHHVTWKADPSNRQKIASVLRHMADTIDPYTETPTL